VLSDARSPAALQLIQPRNSSRTLVIHRGSAVASVKIKYSKFCEHAALVRGVARPSILSANLCAIDLKSNIPADLIVGSVGVLQCHAIRICRMREENRLRVHG
jgi:hypothetical protein